MTVLKSYDLDYNKALAYLKKNLEGVNALSETVLKYAQFTKGEFYTILRADIREQQLYEFTFGGVGGGVRNQAVDLVFDQLQSSNESCCIFDDFNEDYEPNYDGSLFLNVGVHYKNEIYYVVTKKENSKEIVDNCFYCSDVIWHSLCVLSKYSFIKREDRSITEDELIGCVKMAELIFVGAYDEEGFVIWKRTE